jgi:hypothetical protein
MGHTNFINVRKNKGYFDGFVRIDSVNFMINVPARLLEKRKIHTLRIP